MRIAAFTRPDYSALAALALAFGMLALAVAWSGAAAAYLDWPSVFLVLGGTLAVAAVSTSLGEVVQACGHALTIVVSGRADLRGAAARLLQVADRARKDGVRSVEKMKPVLRADPALARAIALAADGVSAEETERLIRHEADATSTALARSAEVFRRASEIAPAMGLIGTLLGLVQMLGALSDPAAIGPGMALALLTTLYGAVLANMVFAPIAAKLDRAAGDQNQVLSLVAVAAGAICRQENPRRLEMLLNAMLPPGQQVAHFK